MNLLRKSLTFPVLFLTSSALFLGGMFFLTKKNSHYISYPNKVVSVSDKTSNSLEKWGATFYEKGDILSIQNIKNNYYAKSIGLKNGDKIIKFNSLYMPNKKEIINFIQRADNSKIINIVIKRGESLYNIKALPPL